MDSNQIIIDYRKLSEKRKKELEILPGFYDDMPKEYLWCSKPLHIPERFLCSEDEFYVLRRLNSRLEYELVRDTYCYYLIYGKKHIFFFIKIDIDDKYATLYGTVGAVIILDNKNIDSCDDKDKILYVIGRALERENGLKEKNDVNSELRKAVVLYKGETV